MAGVGLVYCPLPTVTHTPLNIVDATTPSEGRPARLVLRIAAAARELPAVQDLKKLFGLHPVKRSVTGRRIRLQPIGTGFRLLHVASFLRRFGPFPLSTEGEGTVLTPAIFTKTWALA